MAQSQGFRIGRVIGIPIYIDFSWIIIFSLITYGLSQQFSQQNPKWTSAEHWAVGVLTSLLFFGSVLFHELSHSVVAQHYKLKVVSITLFIFGGLARIGRDPSKAIQEFNIAIAGPLASFFLAGCFFALTLVFPSNQIIGALAGYLWWTNLMLGTFNLLPGFPLDGGRIFRAIVWGVTKDFSKATRVAGASGKLIAYVMIGMGIFSALGWGQGGAVFEYIGTAGRDLAGSHRMVFADRGARQRATSHHSRNADRIDRSGCDE